MLIHELSAAECFEVIGRTHLARLGCARDNQPYIVPILLSFDAEHRCLYGFSAIGQKIDWMRDNPKVCVELDDISDKDHWTTVIVLGRYEEIHSVPDEAIARRRAEQLFRQRTEWWFPGAARVASRAPKDVVVYRIQIDRVSGRRASRGPDPA
jgi:nitroimidazol reductase NimA-like FMN-containing flavoprotein (pyridoxamine 5'-phosphate oxidase superfamily)